MYMKIQYFCGSSYCGMTENEISYKIRGANFKVYNNFGPGLLESIYEEALYYELTKAGLKVELQVPLEVIYDGVALKQRFRWTWLSKD